MFHRYRAALTKEESEAVRQLRRRGFAVVFIEPTTVGSPINRATVEEAMRKAGRAACGEREVRSATGDVHAADR